MKISLSTSGLSMKNSFAEEFPREKLAAPSASSLMESK
jgi:hypothetical protein